VSSLHIIRRREDHFAEEAVRAENVTGRVAVLFIQDAVGSGIDDVQHVFVSEADLRARNLQTPYEKVGYDGMSRLLTEYDRVVVW
jgi:sulfur transfer complex TusBCD TusB component (DsrH family)